MTKHLKLNIKNTQLAQALKIKSDLKKKPSSQAEKPSDSTSPVKKRKSRLLSSSPFEEKEEKPPVVEAPSELEPQIAEETKEEEKPTELIASETKESISTSPIEEKLSPTEKPLSQLPKENPKAETIQEKQPQQKAVQSEERKEIAQGPEAKKSGFKEFKEFRATRKKEVQKGFDSRDRQGLREQDEGWRRRRPGKKLKKQIPEESIIRPKNLKLRLPITVKDLAQEMKLKASQLIQKLFLQGISLTLNDSLDDETTVQLLGHEFDCEIEIDTSEEKRIRITDKTIQEEIAETPKEELEPRSPIITFMGHVDHGKTSLIDAIRKSDIAAGEAGAITQHIGAFKTKISSGEIAILDTPGHEAFSEMRVRGAVVTDLVILVVAGDEGIRDQTIEAIQQAKNAGVPIVVAINKADKPSFDADKIHRQLSDQGLLSEAWGGNVITVNCSATTGQGVMELLELITLQAEILELKADPKARARGTILESEMHKGLGAVATMLVQTGTLKIGDAIVFGNEWGRVKTMHDEHLCHITEAGPSTPVKVTGLSGLAEAGWEFIVVKNEKEARSLAALRSEGGKRNALMQPKAGVEAFLQKQKETATQKVLPLILRADVQGSLEALKTSLMKIQSDKARIEIVNAEVGEISESDVELAIASKATVIGFHTRIESMADGIIKQKKVPVHLHDIIYHAIDNVKLLMKNLLDKIEEENDVGKAEVKAVFKSSQLGKIAGCQVIDGFIKRTSHIRVIREKEVIWKGKISSLKRVKEDVKEVQKGIECGIVLEGFDTFEVGDILQAYEISYREQDL